MNDTFRQFLVRWRRSNRLAVLIVFLAFFLDSILFTCVIPIIPNYLFTLYAPKNVSLCQNCSWSLEISKNSSTRINQTQYQKWSIEAIKNKTAEFHQQQVQAFLLKEDGPIGLMYGSKALAQLITNPVVGYAVGRIGCTIPMLFGFLVMFGSILMFAFSTTYWLLFTSRAIQGIGSSFSAISGISMLAERFKDDKERGIMISRATSGVALGVIIGPVFGGVIYSSLGKMYTFLILAGVALLDGLLRLSIVSTKSDPETEMIIEQPSVQKRKSMLGLLRDKFICITIGTGMVLIFGVAILETTLPTYMMARMNFASPLQQGLAFFPMSISFFIAQNIFGSYSFHIGRWLSAMIGLWIAAVAFLLIPFSTSLVILIFPQFILGIGIGMVMSSVGPSLAALISTRHSSEDYGNAFALFETTLSLSFMIGPPLGGFLVRVIGFRWVLAIVALIDAVYAPLLLFLRPKNDPNVEKVGMEPK